MSVCRFCLAPNWSILRLEIQKELFPWSVYTGYFDHQLKKKNTLKAFMMCCFVASAALVNMVKKLETLQQECIWKPVDQLSAWQGMLRLNL